MSLQQFWLSWARRDKPWMWMICNLHGVCLSFVSSVFAANLRSDSVIIGSIFLSEKLMIFCRFVWDHVLTLNRCVNIVTMRILVSVGHLSHVSNCLLQYEAWNIETQSPNFQRSKFSCYDWQFVTRGIPWVKPGLIFSPGGNLRCIEILYHNIQVLF